MDKNLLNKTFRNAAGRSLPDNAKPAFNRNAQLRDRCAQERAAEKSREARGFGSWGFKPTDKDK